MISDKNQEITINRDRLLERFLRYVRIGTAADPSSARYPSSESQRDLGVILSNELSDMGAFDAHQDDNGLVWGTIPSTVSTTSPTIAFVAHLDTSPEAPGDQVQPQVISPYLGGSIKLLNGLEISIDDCSDLEGLVGTTLITTDGNTLLGGDDKAGVAIIMELAQTLLENPQLPHGTIKVLMTCDEEIGFGTDKIDLAKLDASVAYTIDGGGSGVIDVETFSADAVTAHFVGHNIHPSIAKGTMVNATRAACDFVAALPSDQCTPETTEGRQGFIHTYSIEGGVGDAKVEMLLRSFETEQLSEYATLLEGIARDLEQRTAGLKVDLQVRQQYRNLREGLSELPQSIDLACEAFKTLGRPYERAIIRGGTDGSQLTEKGLPTPNLSSGQHQIHSVKEFACLDQMIEATEHLVILVDLWSKETK